METPSRATIVKRRVAILILVAPLVIFISSQVAIDADRNADLVSRTHCEILDKKLSNKKYHVVTSCGEFQTQGKTYNALTVGNRYDIETTPGNWARSPRIMTASLSG